jgi:hypothetical protein
LKETNLYAGICPEPALKALLLMLLLCTAACTGSAVPTGSSLRQDPREQKLKSVLADAEPLIRNLLSSLNSGNHPQYVKGFDNASRNMPDESSFKHFRGAVKEHLGSYEEGKYQVNKIELYADSYIIYYFVKFEKTEYRDPAQIILKVRRSGEGLLIFDVSYRHALLDS